MHFAPKKEFLKLYKSDKAFKKAISANFKAVFSGEASPETVEACIEANDLALKKAKSKLKKK